MSDVSAVGVPFSVNTTGGIQAATTPEQIAGQRIIDWLLTNPGERLMRPGYGAGMQTYLFEDSEDPAILEKARTILSTLPSVVPGINVVAVSIDPDPIDPSQLNVVVSFTVQPRSQINTINATLNGSVTQETKT